MRINVELTERDRMSTDGKLKTFLKKLHDKHGEKKLDQMLEVLIVAFVQIYGDDPALIEELTEELKSMLEDA